ncbi:DNA mismatch repair endonuclease MutL [Nibricoccus sp. IMCC34717]|uniref:DNA mismatch repair endonuclease MutL n=1 Tax=Nibricoccus sp. IMCC34717 TaxID=3034021 RepID=UPI00384E1409
MGKVHRLPDHVANQIAAGEVIERPAAVIKELVENALDAGATRIEVEFRHGGRSLMRVEDNGGGMSRDDALLALERHATSKISLADDLNRLASFGFRGEALPSIASVSRFELQTREAAAPMGVEIVVNAGRVEHVRECGRPVGTRIEVTHLFNSVPARRKFLKSDTTETAHIVQTVRLYALAFPQVAFVLLEGGRELFRSPRCTDLRERVAELFGRQTAEDLVEIEGEERGQRLSGLIGRPALGRGTRHEMITFINQRPVNSRALNYALIESYQEWLPKGRYPVAFLFYEIDPAAVDVNVHPAKREVRFRNEAETRSFVIRTLLAKLRTLGLGAQATPIAVPVITPFPERPSGESLPVFPLRVTPPNSPASLSPSTPPSTSTSPSPSTSTSTSPSTKSWRWLGVAHSSNVLYETPAGIVVLDRRATHERIWFERILREFRSGHVTSQSLLLPVPLELDPVAAALLRDQLEFFRSHGFAVVEWGGNCFRIEAVPQWMEPLDAETFVRDLVGSLRDGTLHASRVDVARDELARLASARAVRLPELRNEVEARALVHDLFSCENPLLSPSGRATYFELSHGELGRRLHRPH